MVGLNRMVEQEDGWLVSSDSYCDVCWDFPKKKSCPFTGNYSFHSWFVTYFAHVYLYVFPYYIFCSAVSL